MNGPIVQAVALTAFGNQYLRDGRPLDIWPGSKVFQFCKTVDFIDWVVRNEQRQELPFAADPQAWLQRLRGDDIRSLHLRHEPTPEPKFPDHKMAGMTGGGGRWLIEARGTGWADFWVARWEVGHRDDPERRIWDVTYGRIAKLGPSSGAEDLPMDRISASLAELLPEIALFADKHHLGSYAAQFRRAAAALAGPLPLAETYHSDLAECRLLPLPAQQLLAAAQFAWVFGGMGSWNDLGFDGDDQHRYDDLSEHLYMLLVAAICSATNATSPSASAKGVIVPPSAPSSPAARPLASKLPPLVGKPWWQRLLGR